MILSQQVSSDLLNVAGGTFYALICAYQVNLFIYLDITVIRYNVIMILL